MQIVCASIKVIFLERNTSCIWGDIPFKDNRTQTNGKVSEISSLEIEHGCCCFVYKIIMFQFLTSPLFCPVVIKRL